VSEWAEVNVPLDTTGHFRDESYQAIDYSLQPRENTQKVTLTQTNWLYLRKNTKPNLSQEII